MLPEEITVENVLETLTGLDEEEKKAVQEAADKKAAEAAEQARKHAEEEAKAKQSEPKKEPAGRGQDESLQVAWSLVEDHVKETCPDLDEDMLAIVKAASSGPVDFKTKAKQMQLKVAAKKGTAETDEEKQKRALAEKVFGESGGPGGDANLAKQKGAPTTEESLKTAVEKSDSKAILQSVAQTITDKKLFGRGVSLIVE